MRSVTKEVFDYFLDHLLEPRSTEGDIKSPLSVCQSGRLPVSQFGVFLRNGGLVFSDFWQDGRYWNI